jgi:hypothetical protein
MDIEFFGWFSTFFLWGAALPKQRHVLHLCTAIAALSRAIYITTLYFGPTGNLARPLLINWIALFVIHLYQYFAYKNK